MNTEIPNINRIHDQNKSAWDALYRDTSGSVWGPDPIPFVAEFIAELELNWSPATRVLDAASGEGRHLPLLIKSGASVDACDSSEHALAKVSGDYESVQVSHCDLDRLPYPAEQFDFVSLIDTIETLPDPVSCLSELNRALKTGGHLLCNIPGIEDQISGEGMDPLDAPGSQGYLYDGLYYYRFYDEEEAASILQDCGFSIVRNEVRSWEESSHPGFRDYEHQHTSRVFLLRKE